MDDHHRLHVLEREGTDPCGPYVYKAKLATDAEDKHYAIDGSVLQKADGSLYLLWAGRPDHVLFIAPMSDPWTVSGERVHLPADGFGCAEVREGPVVPSRGWIFLVYSAYDTGKPDYKLGLLIVDEAGDPLDPASRTQYASPVFERSDMNGVYGPGHNHFFQSPDGTEDWIVYHAKAESWYTYAGRSPRAQRFTDINHFKSINDTGGTRRATPPFSSLLLWFGGPCAGRTFWGAGVAKSSSPCCRRLMPPVRWLPLSRSARRSAGRSLLSAADSA